MADLANIAASQEAEYRPDEAFELELNGPDGAQLFNDGDDTPMTISVLGADSDVAVQARNRNSNKRLAQGVRMKLTAEGLDSEGAAYLAKLTVGWNITLGGERPTFSYEAALRLYSNPKLAFIREQVDLAIGDRANFLKRSPTN